ncbi:RBBP9/YdeN family alpha/beta hydrolase [Acetobacter tropicalis]|uniref:Hydrolase n=1 Tax=Acetobacter tropicalis TaxID=104102 RepID=A0A252A5C9_9PROT|nr:alpha/beta hydrolase [Acetobacter tropicalis]OUI84601.1 hydrolase [Acetobacter tropicalis]
MPTSLRHSAVHPHAADFLATTPRLSPALVRALSPFDMLVVPGLFGSDEDHWQSIWEDVFRGHGLSIKRVEQENWSHPTLSEWQAKLEQTLQASRRPVLLIAHSLGAILSVHHGLKHPASPVAGALLVAPADGEQSGGPDAARLASFLPLPDKRLPFPSTVIFSQNDPWLTPTRAHQLAGKWGASLLDAGYTGHIGNNSGVDYWPLGLNALHSLALTCHAGQMPAHA